MEPHSSPFPEQNRRDAEPNRRDGGQRDGGRRQPPGTLGTGRGSASPPRPSGWRVTPAPDGRGSGSPPGGSQSRGPNPRWLIALIVVGLLALNLWISSQALQPAARVQIPYSPTFLAQVNQDNVTSISS